MALPMLANTRFTASRLLSGSAAQAARSRSVPFGDVLQRAQCLRPQAVLAAIPEQEGRVRRAHHRHRSTLAGPHALPELATVLELLVGGMATGASDLAV